MSGFVFDAGALIAFERNDRAVVLVAKRLLALHGKLVVPAGVVGQVWRDGARQVRLARLLGSPIAIVEPLDDRRARAAGQLCGLTRTRDVIDAAVVLSAREHKLPVATSDPDDLRRLDPHLRLFVV
jgi:PIN domain